LPTNKNFRNLTNDGVTEICSSLSEPWPRRRNHRFESLVFDALGLRERPASHVPEIVRRICVRFQHLIETNGLDAHLYCQGKLRHERFAHLLFYAIADTYCEANGLDLSREPNAGVGPVDFKVSQGAHSKVNVEVKYSTNKKLVHGYTRQLPKYNQAEGTVHSFYLIIRTGRSEVAIRRIKELEGEARTAGKRAAEVFVVDGRLKPSASKV